MKDVNWWLMTLAFLLGMLVTFAMMIRKVTREVPVGATVSAGLRGGVEAPKVAAPDLGKVAGAKVVAEKVDDIIDRDPYGKGSIRVKRRASAPAGYPIKGDQETGRYYPVLSPYYDKIEAEVWFADEESAEKADFLRWDVRKGAAPDGGSSGVAKFASDAAAAKIASADDLPPGPHGRGSFKAGADGVGPTGWTIKGNEDSMLYHTVDSPWYGQTIAEVWFDDEASARAAGFTRWDEKRGANVAAIADVPAGPYGKGSASADADGSGPAGWLIKGNADSMLYHGIDSPAYEVTIAEVWFFDEATAKAAGFDKWDKNFQ